MVEKRKPVPVKEAIERVMKRVTQLEKETVPLHEAYGRILAEPVRASHHVPPFDRSPYDGFAVRSADTQGASGETRVAFRVIDHIGAGAVSKCTVGEQEAVRIMTGAPLPAGADAVVMLEQAVIDEDAFTIRKPFGPLENVSLKGEDAREGEIIAEAGTFINPGVVAVLATFGYAKVTVSKKPVVGLLATGTELVEAGEPLQPGKIRNSNGPMIAAQLARMGIGCRLLGSLPDDEDACFELVKKAAAECDVVITTGGVSVGDFDFLPAVYKRLEADVLFNKVQMRPGSVTTVAHTDNTFLFGLSGNPSACFVGFELFTRPAILAMMGNRKPFLPYEKAVLDDDYTKPNPFNRFIRAVYESTPAGARVRPAGFNKSNSVTSIARGNAFIVLPGGTRGFQKGDEVDVLIIGSEEGVSSWELN
ncbi:molybdopterin molybdotransferase MoeA [Domibacillus indicus]|uniref:molybdopterin molybdotransferase MoeA n=1 Tax=Domibacillus indicus TaxID=1437523 RepID=UPI000617F9B1|nr:gephyrin-like molybdotransferase Glp [Domibacillus indicus]